MGCENRKPKRHYVKIGDETQVKWMSERGLSYHIEKFLFLGRFPIYLFPSQKLSRARKCFGFDSKSTFASEKSAGKFGLPLATEAFNQNASLNGF